MSAWGFVGARINGDVVALLVFFGNYGDGVDGAHPITVVPIDLESR